MQCVVEMPLRTEGKVVEVKKGELGIKLPSQTQTQGGQARVLDKGIMVPDFTNLAVESIRLLFYHSSLLHNMSYKCSLIFSHIF